MKYFTDEEIEAQLPFIILVFVHYQLQITFILIIFTTLTFCSLIINPTVVEIYTFCIQMVQIFKPRNYTYGYHVP